MSAYCAWSAALLLSLPLEMAFADERLSAPTPDCEARVGYDRDRVMLGYLLPTAAGKKTCIPFSTVAAYPPAGYKGDFYVDEFTDEKLRQRWAECKRDKVCDERVSKQIDARRPPNKEYRTTEPKHLHLLGKVTGRG
ncbi:MAG TPA: hypothetical protein VIU34_04675, partial [Steroidobacter sp.]